jgi:hypothetical protein
MPYGGAELTNLEDVLCLLIRVPKDLEPNRLHPVEGRG